MLSHVLPDLINKIKNGQDPVHILGTGDQIRCYTNGRDIGKGIRVIIESEAAINEDFNISIAQPTSVLELAELVWNKLNPGKPFSFVSDDPFEYDVQKRIPDVTKAKVLLGFTAEIPLSESIDEVIEYLK
jgi:nucleoside-diphosphate-sugar epimerase